MPASPPPSSVRADAWTWAIRLYSTRSAASAACKAGHVKVNDAAAKPATPVRVGDTVRAYTPGGERIVVVTGLIEKRTSATLAALNYDDRTPPPPPKTKRHSAKRRRRSAMSVIGHVRRSVAGRTRKRKRARRQRKGRNES